MKYYFISNIITNFGPLNLFLAVAWDYSETIVTCVNEELERRDLTLHQEGYKIEEISYEEYQEYFDSLKQNPLR